MRLSPFFVDRIDGFPVVLTYPLDWGADTWIGPKVLGDAIAVPPDVSNGMPVSAVRPARPALPAKDPAASANLSQELLSGTDCWAVTVRRRTMRGRLRLTTIFLFFNIRLFVFFLAVHN